MNTHIYNLTTLEEKEFILICIIYLKIFKYNNVKEVRIIKQAKKGGI